MSEELAKSDTETVVEHDYDNAYLVITYSSLKFIEHIVPKLMDNRITIEVNEVIYGES